MNIKKTLDAQLQARLNDAIVVKYKCPLCGRKNTVGTKNTLLVSKEHLREVFIKCECTYEQPWFSIQAHQKYNYEEVESKNVFNRFMGETDSKFTPTKVEIEVRVAPSWKVM